MKSSLKQLLDTIGGGGGQTSLEELISGSISELELGFEVLGDGERSSLAKFSLGLMEAKSSSKTFHQARMALLAVVVEKLSIREILSLSVSGSSTSTHLLHSVGISSLEIRLFLDSKLVELEDARFSQDGKEKVDPTHDDVEISILTSSFRILDSVLSQLNMDENLDFLESCGDISGAQVVELLESLKATARHCVEFVLDAEEAIRDEFEMSPNSGQLEPKSRGKDKDKGPPGASSLYWMIYYSCSISSKWQINEPDEELGRFIRLLEIAARYLNPLHFACVFPTMIHLSVIDWANVPGILEALLTSMLSFCILIRTEGSKDGSYSGLYYAALLITSAWWSPGIDTYRIPVSRVKTGSRSFEYLPRNYINLDHLDRLKDGEISIPELRAQGARKSGTNMPEFAPLDTNTIPEYSFEDSPGVDRVRRISLIVFEIIQETNQREAEQLIRSPPDQISFTDALNSADSADFERLSAFIQTLICILSLLTCRIQNSYVPSELWSMVFRLIIVLTPKSGKGYYYDSPRKVALFISLLRSTAIAFSTGYPSQARQFLLLLENLKIEATYTIPKLVIRENCEEFSEQDEHVVNFFRSLLDIS
ncbi:hypothetical protein OJ253_1048 [Cryptosporidium canis]|uniref:Uncharacterized protein n=1 Tax=Cryptosporidium canis TaxID=195482 RepID=A0A9D5DHP3_9CRYT|nr:hypothetical protein OJ253_1048 [Cryptosporidium canis]